ncbi:MAG: hypothetical protein CFH21_01110 [Alphaproteobacteria bacterium MarineAlpha5_Bin11]|nr:hypothetical protein [Pelagibacteraceae bacterium]PPR42436.1 MAG: hypothetical protein CFH21_01110 [Alphaproteobacteria bacterium MarineAlpha5_Bin11]PPR50466.1 MAG: hypothetical protein CFH20_00925 [Alphaproteobacteria bacterium MarineAlpha5_Bin10]|tara:strand:- start:141 stop:641 length:501 start_codon:yes stop_codon:yes gene_type:complete
MALSNLYNQKSENPLDILEEMISLKRWPCSRSNNDELVSEIQSKLCAYRLYFAWSKEINAVSLTISLDLKIPESMKDAIFKLLCLINENLWLGHFDVTSKNGILAYRNTYIIGNEKSHNINILEDIIDIGITECEKFYPSFQMVLWENYEAERAIETCLLETKGSA